MRLATVEALPDSASSGPESWGEAFGKVVSATDQTMVAIENINASQENFRASYQSYIDEVEQATGVKLDNPMNIDMRRGAFEERPNPQYGTGTGTEWMDERQRAAMERFDAQRQALAEQYPAQARLIQLDIDGRAKKRMQDADRAAKEALASPELGMGGRFAAQLIGGLTGSAKDPYQWAMAMTGGAPGAGRTVAGRIGHVLLTEALLNGGQEAVLQAASQERKRSAGLEHGLDDALKNVGIAATFGALFGGTVQGASELARIYKLGEGGEEIAARVLDGRPEPGDIETMAKAMNVELSPDRLDLINRSFEDRVLDDVMTPDETSPGQMRVYEAALRYAEDPDNAMPPEMVERLVAEEEAPRLQTLTPEQYERAYGGNANAIDDIADTFFADDFSRAAEKIDAAAARVEDIAARAENTIAGFQTEKGSVYTVSGQSTTRNKAARDLPGHEGDFGTKEPSALTIYVDENAGALSAAGLNGLGSKGARVALKDGKATLVTWNERQNGWGASDGSRDIPYHLEPAVGRYPLELWREAGDVPGYAAFSKMHAGNRIVSVSQVAPDTGKAAIRPDIPSEPLDEGAMRIAESEAGDIAEPARDRNGNPENMLDFIGIEDGDGNVQIVSAREALDMADEDNLLADLMEACKL